MMKKIDILIPYNEIIRKRNLNFKKLIKESENGNSICDLKYDCDEEYIKELEQLINSILNKIDEEEHYYKVCKNCNCL